MTQKTTAATPEVAQPVQDAGVPPVPQYAPQPAAAYYPQAAVDPNRGKAKWLTFEYLLAMVSTVLSALLFAQVLVALFGAWVKTTSTAAGTSSVDGWLGAVLSMNMVTPGTGIVMAGVSSVLFAVVAFITFGRVSRAIPDRDNYTSRSSYKVITYGAFGALLIPAIVLVAKLGTILISSLLFIGAGDPGKVYGMLYLGEFVPYLLALGVIGATLWMLKGIISGSNTSKAMTLILLGAASAALIAGAITVAVQAHNTGSTTQRGTRSTMCDKYGVGCD